MNPDKFPDKQLVALPAVVTFPRLAFVACFPTITPAAIVVQSIATEGALVGLDPLLISSGPLLLRSPFGITVTFRFD